jgi:hypothetical protein
MGGQVDELIEQIRIEADTHRVRQDPDTPKAKKSIAAELDRLRANLVIARRAQDQLPPVTSYRHGPVAQIELWLKRGLKRITRWFTWEQANFNAATYESFHATLAMLARLEQNISDLCDRIEGNSANCAGNADIKERLANIEQKLQTIISDSELRSLGSLRDEQRVYFKQLGLQTIEAAVIAERTKRNFQMQLDGLARRLDELQKTHAEIQPD